MQKLQNYLLKLNFNELSQIQKETIASFSLPKHIVGLAPTGTGKTHAYLLPILARLIPNGYLQTIIIVPTNELVTQVTRMLKETDDTFSVKSYYGSIDMQKEVAWLEKRQPDIIITTPAKLNYLIHETHSLNLSRLKYFILDEADMMFDESFLSLLDHALYDVKVEKFLLFSATLTHDMQPFIKKYFGEYILIDTDESLKISYPLIRIGMDRTETLLEVVARLNPYLAIIFVSKNESIQPLYDKMLSQNYQVVSLSSDIDVKKRRKILADIMNLKYTYVIASDLIARGIDFKASHIIHYDLPHFLEFFKHRSGRTGRMGDSGVVITLYDENDRRKIDKLRNQGIPFKSYHLTEDEIVANQVRNIKKDKVMQAAVKAVKKDKKVKPNYKKKYKKRLKKAVQQVKKERYKQNAKNR